MCKSILLSDGWTTEPPTKPGRYWFFGDSMMGGMGIDHTDKAECKIGMRLVTVWGASNCLVGVCDGVFVGLKRFEKMADMKVMLVGGKWLKYQNHQLIMKKHSMDS